MLEINAVRVSELLTYISACHFFHIHDSNISRLAILCLPWVSNRPNSSLQINHNNSENQYVIVYKVRQL